MNSNKSFLLASVIMCREKAYEVLTYCGYVPR